MIGISKRQWKFHIKTNLLKLIICTIIYYGIIIWGRKFPIYSDMQILSLIPLLGTTLYFYKVCSSECLKKCYLHPTMGWNIKSFGGLCWEIYLVQGVLFTDKTNRIFPINIIIMFIILSTTMWSKNIFPNI